VSLLGEGARRVGSALQALAAPAAAAGRAIARTPVRMMSVRHFGGGTVDRFTADWNPALRPPDDVLRRDLRKMRARARQLSRDSDIADAFLDLITTNVLGDEGIQLEPQVRRKDGKLDEEVNAEILRAWTEWSEGPVTLDGQLNLNQYELLLLETRCCDGEAFSRFHNGAEHPHGLALEPIDADMLDERFSQRLRDGGEIRLGIEVDPRGRPVRYHFFEGMYTSRPILSGYRAPVAASEIAHLFRRRRPNQVRGYTDFASVMWVINMADAYLDGELIAARHGNHHLGFVQWKDDGAPGAVTTEQQSKPIPTDAEPGTIWELPKGASFASWDPQHPNNAFPDFMKNIERRIASGLKVSHWSLFQNLENVNLSSIRGGMLAERDRFKKEQAMWIWQWKRQLFHRWLRQAILTGALDLPSKDWRLYTPCAWKGRRWPWPDPMKDMQAKALAIDYGLESRQEIVAQTGGRRWDKVREELQHEEETARDDGVPIHGDNATAAGTAGEVSTAVDDALEEKQNGSGARASRSRLQITSRNGRQ
jgi:lambda family phage portal protein